MYHSQTIVGNALQDKGSLLGVVGTDVALPQLQNVVPGYEVSPLHYFPCGFSRFVSTTFSIIRGTSR